MAGEEHNTILVAMIQHFEEKGYTIHCADFEGYKKCEKVTTHIPDIIAADSDGLWHIGEAESCKALERYQTIKQFKAFSSLVMSENDSRQIPFYIGIPERCNVKLDNILNKEGIKSNTHVLYVDL